MQKEVESFKTTHSPENIKTITEKWIKVCQESLEELQQRANAPTTMEQLLAHYQVDTPLLKTLRFDPDTDSFS